MITLDVNVLEHNARRTASWFPSRILRILTTLYTTKSKDVQNDKRNLYYKETDNYYKCNQHLHSMVIGDIVSNKILTNQSQLQFW